MRRRMFLLAVITILGATTMTSVAAAQFIVPVNPYGFGLNYTRVTPNSVLQIGIGSRAIGYGSPFGPIYGPVSGPFVGAPFYPGPVAPWGNNFVRQTTIIINPPGLNPLTGWPLYPRGPIVDGLGLQVLPNEFFNGPLGNAALNQEVNRIRNALPQPLPDPNRGLLPPRDREEDRIQVKIDRQAIGIVRPPAGMVMPPAAAAKPAVQVELPRLVQPPLPLDNQQAEYIRLLTEGRVAFGKGEYGRATERFGAAITRQPAEGAGWFLRSQSNLALAKFLDSARDLREGLRLFPDGLVAGFVPANLYGDKAAEYASHRLLLEETLKGFAGDVDLALLAAVQCWLDGEKAEAVGRMEKLPANERRLVEKFLQAAPRVAAAP